jgi:hypothetical protein
MSRPTENSPIGLTDCTFCGAKVVVRKSHKTGKAYWTCDGDHDVRACHSQVRLGPRPSRDLLDQRPRRSSSAPPAASGPGARSSEPAREAPREPGPTAALLSVPAAAPRPPAAPAQAQPAPVDTDNPFDIMGNLFGWTRKVPSS